MRVLTQVPPPYLERVRRRFPDVEFVELPLTGPVEEVKGDVLFTSPAMVDNMPQVLAGDVPWVHVLPTGVDLFPVEMVGDRVLTCARGATSVAMAEWALAVMLAFEKQLPQQWVTEPTPLFFNGTLGTLSGRTLALVGFGTIGQQIARYAQVFGMNVRAIRRTGAPSPVGGVHIAGSLPELLDGAHHIVLVAPATPATRHLMDRAAFASVSPGAHLVNIARGALVDEDALREALDDGRIARASLDCTDPEPLPAGHWMYGHPRVLVSPHVSFSSPDAIDATADVFADNLERWMRNQPLQGLVDKEQRY